MNSVNQPWAISDKYRSRYGEVWANIDFEFNSVSEKLFHDSPMSTIVGRLIVANVCEDMSMNDLGITQAAFKNLINESAFASGNTCEVRIKSKYVMLNKPEATRLFETIEDATTTITRKFQLGLYL